MLLDVGRGWGSVVDGVADDFAWLATALPGEAEDGGPVYEAVYGGHGCGLGGKEILPVLKAGVGRQDDAALAVAGTDDAEEVVGAISINRGIREFVE